MERRLFKLLAQLNRLVLPSFTRGGLDIVQAKKWQKAVLAWRYYVTCRSLD